MTAASRLRQAVTLAVACAIIGSALTGCVVGALTGPYAEVRNALRADPAVIDVDGKGPSNPGVSNVSFISIDLKPDVTTADLQRVAEIARAKFAPFTDQRPDPELRFMIGAPPANRNTERPGMTLSEFKISKKDLAAEIAFWRDVAATAPGSTSSFLAIQYPWSGAADYERVISVTLGVGQPASAELDTYAAIAALTDPTRHDTHWSIGYDDGYLSSYPAFPPSDVLAFWAVAVTPGAAGGVPSLRSESSIGRDLRVDIAYGSDDPDAWTQLVETTRAALSASHTMTVIARAGDFTVYVGSRCDDGHVNSRNAATDRSAELIATLGEEGAGLGICDD